VFGLPLTSGDDINHPMPIISHFDANDPGAAVIERVES
jgi:hypothetical protein